MTQKNLLGNNLNVTRPKPIRNQTFGLIRVNLLHT